MGGAVVKDQFAEYYRPSEADFTALWAEAIVALDASAMLNLYFYSSGTAETYLTVLELFKDRIWLPHQAGLEFQRNRIGVLVKAAKGYSDAKKSLALIRSQFHARSQPPFLDPDLLRRFDAIADEITGAVDQAVEAIESRWGTDPLRDRLDALFAGRVGKGFAEKALAAIYSEGRERYKSKVPPGYKDEKEKTGNDAFGDLVIWKELIEQAKTEKKPLIFVTDDAKEDWWLLQDDKTVGPRPELLKEFAQEAGQRCYLYSSEGFLRYADRHLTATVGPDALAEVRDARLRDRLLSFERGFEDLPLPSDEEIEEAREATEALDPESEEYIEAFNRYRRMADQRLADAFQTSIHPTLSPGIQRLRAELIGSIRSLLSECRQCPTWSDRSEYKLSSWLEYVEEEMIPYTSLPNLRRIKTNLEELLARHRQPDAR